MLMSIHHPTAASDEEGKLVLAQGMQWLGVSYTVWFNRRHRRSGHLLEGRFKAILVEFDARGAEMMLISASQSCAHTQIWAGQEGPAGRAGGME